VILLERNYRSSQTILDVANAVIARNLHRHPKRLYTEKEGDPQIMVWEAYDEQEEGDMVISEIQRLVAQGKVRLADCAVMYRTNAQSRLLEEAFLHAGLPYKLVGAQRFYGRREIKDVIAYLRLVHNPRDELSLTRVINVPPRGIGDKTFIALRTQAKKLGLPPGELLLEIGRSSESDLGAIFGGRTGASLANFGSLLKGWIAMKADVPPLALIDRILEDTDYHFYIDDGTPEGQDRWENVMELRRLASEFQEQGLQSFLEQVALVSDQDTLDVNANVPTLLTLHAAKGLEFNCVFIVGMIDGTLPHSRSFEDPEAMMEERRLLYVGITRAKDRLFLVFPQHRNAYGYAEPVEPSRFLSDIPEDFMDYGQLARGAYRVAVLPSRPERWSMPNESSGERTNTYVIRYQPGMRVQHPAWGEGMVLNSRQQDNDEVVDIFFEGMGLKRVVASLANLEIKPYPK
jgi:DNA helicase-2/ATP-dependent DNA helicase PcrA